MEASELLKKVRKIEIKTKGLSNQIFTGEYHSAFKGKGMTFSEVREYQHGDDIRTIDWNVTARFNSPYVKVFEEERELTVMLIVDISASESFGTQIQLKQDMITEICAVLAFSAIQNNDKIGVIFFSNQVEKFIPPKKGKSHILRIIRELLNFEPENKTTDLSVALKFFNNIVKKRSIAFVISDFIDTNFENPLKLAKKRHDVVALKIFDDREKSLPNIGLVKFIDSESGRHQWIDSSDKIVRDGFAKKANDEEVRLKNIFRRSGVDFALINTTESYIKPLMNLFKKR